MKALFLDIDGVVNNAGNAARFGSSSLLGIDPALAFIVGKIPLYTDCVVVLSSSWRHWPQGITEVEKRITPLYDKTPTSRGGFRGDEVRTWLANHPEIDRYAIVDDSGDFHPDQPLFKTSWQTGITQEIADAIINYLNEETS